MTEGLVLTVLEGDAVCRQCKRVLPKGTKAWRTERLAYCEDITACADRSNPNIDLPEPKPDTPWSEQRRRAGLKP